jgi:hypothetical protein
MWRRISTLFGDGSFQYEHSLDYKIYAGDHEWHCINSDSSAQ